MQYISRLHTGYVQHAAFHDDWIGNTATICWLNIDVWNMTVMWCYGNDVDIIRRDSTQDSGFCFGSQYIELQQIWTSNKMILN